MQPLSLSYASYEAAQVVRSVVTHSSARQPQRAFSRDQTGRKTMALSQPRSSTSCFHTWDQALCSCDSTMPGAWHSFCAHSGYSCSLSVFGGAGPSGVSSWRFSLVQKRDHTFS